MKKYVSLFFSIVQISIVFTQEKDTTFILKEIEISATRKTTTSFKEPSAISIVNAKDFSKGKGYGLDEALTLVPGVFAQSRYGNQDIRLTIRGFGARGSGERSNSGTSRGIRVLLDGFPETEPDGRTSFDNIDLSTMGRIEVVRSNSSALWGNAAGGLVSISSNTMFDKPFIALQSSAGSFGFQKNVLQLGTTIGSGKFFLNLSNTNSDGWREHSSSTQSMINTGIVAPLAERTYLGVFILGTTNYFKIPGPLSKTQNDTNPQQAQDDTNYYNPTYVQRDERRFNRLGRIGVSLSHSINETNDLSATAYINPKYLQRSERNSFRDFNRYHIGGSFVYKNSLLFNENLKVNSSIGVDEAYQDGAILFYALKAGQRDSLIDNKREGANSFGTFLQEEVQLNDNIILSAGARYDNVKYISENYFSRPYLTEQKSFEKVTPKLGIVYQFTSHHSIYASFGGGVEVPAGNETDPAAGQVNAKAINPLLEPIVSTTYEVGTKQFILFDNLLIKNISYDGAAYLISTTNDIVPYQNGKFYLTAGETRRMGIEIGVTTQFEHGFSFTGALTLSSNKYVIYTIDSVFTKAPIALSLTGKSISYNDNAVVGIPDFLLNLRLRYDEVPFVEGLYFELLSQSIGGYFADDANSLKVTSYTIVNGTVGYSTALKFVENLFIKGFVSINNLTDQKYVSSAYINPDLGKILKQAIYLEPGLPQFVVASLGLNYQF